MDFVVMQSNSNGGIIGQSRMSPRMSLPASLPGLQLPMDFWPTRTTNPNAFKSLACMEASPRHQAIQCSPQCSPVNAKSIEASPQTKTHRGENCSPNSPQLHKDMPADPGSWTFTAERVLGSGSFGTVYQAEVAETGESVAIKKVFQDKRYKNRELQIMRELKHPNVVELKHAFYTTGDKQGETYLNVVMEYCSDTVYSVIKHYA